MAWTNSQVLEFLDLYRKEPVLWDPKNPAHKTRSDITAAWNRIQASFSMDCSVVDLKKKKESLMTSFRMHMNRKKKRCGDYQPTWFLFSHMESFLGGNYECDSTSQMQQQLFNNPTHAPSHQQLVTETNIGTRSNSNESNTVSRYSTKTFPQANAKPKKANSNIVFVKKDFKEEPQDLEKAIEIKNFDEYDLYGQLLAKKLRKLEEHQRDVAMHEIDNIMFKAKMQGSTSQTQSFTSTSPVHRKMKSPIFIVTQHSHEYEDENLPYQEHMQPQAPS
ncbi:PREDICTED: uncharacterized protein LOC106117692 [Papilio xuthus]|uniref:Uncharacterized protein LOC106117692 n=1 Tax=Papilio xuthus TaxID=66420 RepID=A0AAJ7E8Z0_PAPXU|nr:PREDICTED: uncharacterized protein LOC106117692 [Papilio xuthus]